MQYNPAQQKWLFGNNTDAAGSGWGRLVDIGFPRASVSHFAVATNDANFVGLLFEPVSGESNSANEHE